MSATDDRFSVTPTTAAGNCLPVLRAIALAVLGLACAAGHCLAATEALNSIVPNGVDAFEPGGGGFAFRPASDISITALGHHLDSSTTLTNQTVELLDASGTILASANINLNTPNSGQFWYEPIYPVFLPAGSTNFVNGYDRATYLASGNKVWVGTVVDRDTPSSAWFDVAPGLVYLGPTRGTTLSPDGTNALYYGVNFQFGPPIRPTFLKIALVPVDQVMLYWPTQSVGFVLQATADLVSAPMTNVLTPRVINGTNYAVVVTRSAPQTFYRLLYAPN